MNITIISNIVVIVLLFLNYYLSHRNYKSIHDKVMELELAAAKDCILKQEIQDKRQWLKSFMKESVVLAQENEKLKAQLGEVNGEQIQEQESRTARTQI